jgi:hypothetical protein
MIDYGPGLIEHHLLSELVAEGLLEKEGTQFFYRGPRQDYRIEMTITAVAKTVRLSED